MADCDLLIIGAGISGLSMAHYAVNAGLNTLVLERERRIGGCLHSHHFADMDNFWLELGAHSCFRSYRNLLAILENLQLFEQLTPRAKVRFRMFAEGEVKTISSQLCYPELMQAPFRLLGLGKTGRNLSEYYGHIVGKHNYEAVFSPAFDSVLSQASAEFPADHLFVKRTRRKDAPRGFTLPDGVQTISDALAAHVQIESRQPVRAIRRDGEAFIVSTDEGDYSARALCLATPIAVTARLLYTEFPEVAERLAQVRTAMVETVGVAVSAAHVQLPAIAGLIGRDQDFFSVVSRDTVPDPDYRGFTFHFRWGALDEAGKLERISQVLNIPKGEIAPHQMVNKTNRLPALRVGHTELIRKVDALLTESRVALTGNYFSGVAIEDCVIRSLGEFERLRQEGL